MPHDRTDTLASSRRRFLASAAATGGVLAASRVLSQDAPLAGVHAAGDSRLRVGVIGSGNRGRGAAQDALEAGEDVVIVAMADAFQDRLEDAVSLLQRAFPERVEVPKERQFVGFDAYQSVLACDLDLVILATPPGFRPIHFEAAVDAGKHVFMEKPVAVDAPGVRRVLEAGRKAQAKRLAVGVGLQRRHEQHYLQTIEKIHAGALGGDPLYTRVYWNGGGVWTRPRRPEQTEMEYQMRNWYYFNWLCGDHIVEQHIHNLDVGNWVMNATPVEARGMGGRQVRTGIDNGEIFDHHTVEYTYADGSTMMSQCRHIPGTWTSVNEFAHGPTGSCHVGNGIFLDRQGKTVSRLKRPFKTGYGTEHADLQASIRANNPYNETSIGAEATLTAIMGRMATYSGQVIKWDEAMNSSISLAPERYAFDATPPVLPDSDGRYPIAEPGKTVTV
ncbi:Gfo/Idh/MocA family protein [Botrimarina hoheduenensis]|uniref:Inositol 2-dehydrogenase n=1 Tax=Botrimarina hoheduenensis TaxID=2528000 RepID=A0A5C5WDQ6_9BACT|nr:Gfo/Idh/MocA family oxidoreductase [Botrimarina hoheduenensis]TWT47822.1 Inositol 2-dehydrogenase [Botrimarina hoheduenensis]